MHRALGVVGAVLFVLSVTEGQSEQPPTAQGVVERAEAKFRENVRNEEVVFAVRIIDDRGRVNERTLRFLTSYGVVDQGDKVFLRFLHPADIRGVGLLNLANPGGEDTQYLFLRSVGKARRVASSNRRDRFVGTDYSIGDTRLENIHLWIYRHLEEVTLALPPVYGGTTTPTYRLEAVPQGADTDYARRVLWYHRDLSVLVKEEMYDREGVLTKTRTRWGFTPFTTVSNQTVLRPQFEEMMNNRAPASRTVLEALHRPPEFQRRFNQDLPDSTFTTNELEKGR